MRPVEPRDLDFELTDDYVPENVLHGDLELLGIHVFVREDENEEHVPLALVFMSNKDKKDYKKEAYRRREGEHRLLRNFLSLLMLPHEHVRPTFEALCEEAANAYDAHLDRQTDYLYPDVLDDEHCLGEIRNDRSHLVPLTSSCGKKDGYLHNSAAAVPVIGARCVEGGTGQAATHHTSWMKCSQQPHFCCLTKKNERRGTQPFREHVDEVRSLGTPPMWSGLIRCEVNMDVSLAR
uniref:Uncharacterized protein n=1 Tax=Branchiostoma floridae TaxID=7739 RepID=C4A0C7_BRAFL|eukprot:XP_002585743.1 hypothetical protein BRAFLDRAFT_111269 [Branchiostoma floridae]